MVITWQVIQNEIGTLKKNKSLVPDEIFPLVLKEPKKVTSRPLTDIFERSVNSGYVPNQWRVANVTLSIKNCGPISLISASVLGKMLGSIVARGIWDHLEKQFNSRVHDG